jgi:hypothetical protein
MRFSRLLLTAVACAFVLGAVSVGNAATVTFSGTVSYTGSYVADTLYCAVMDTTGMGGGGGRAGGPTLLAYQALPIGSAPFAVPFSLDLDNAGLTSGLWLACLLDVDHTGFVPDSLNNVVTTADLVGWYDGHSEPVLVDPSTSHAGLDYSLGTGEIRGNIVFAVGQSDAEVRGLSVPNGWNAENIRLTGSGPYALLGTYAGSYVVTTYGGPFGQLCWGDPTCVAPTILTLSDGQIVTGIDFTYSTSPVEAETWGRVKTRYR